MELIQACGGRPPPTGRAASERVADSDRDWRGALKSRNKHAPAFAKGLAISNHLNPFRHISMPAGEAKTSFLASNRPVDGLGAT